ncbi:hypothetical protein BOX15_Mlig031127g1, partial [Macrostomum lignano]
LNNFLASNIQIKMNSESSSGSGRGRQFGGFGRGRPVTKQSNLSNNSSTNWQSQQRHRRQPAQHTNQQRWDSDSSATATSESAESVESEQKVELGETFQQYRELLTDVYTMAGSSSDASQTSQRLLQLHPALLDSQLEELAKLVVKATEEGHSHLSLLGQVDPSRAGVALLQAYGSPFQHRFDSLLLRRLQALQSRAERSRSQNFVTGFDEKFVAFLGELASLAPLPAFRCKSAVYFLTAIEAFLNVQLASVDRWRRAITPLHECSEMLFNPELRDANSDIDQRLAAIGKLLALAETDRFMAGVGCTFVRPMLAELLEKLRTEGLLARRQ